MATTALAIVYMIASGAYSPEAILSFREVIQSEKVLGPLLFIVFFMLFQPLGVASHGLILLSAAIWPWPQAFIYSVLGATLAGVLSFFFARYVGYEWVQRHLPEKIRRLEDKLVENQFRNIFLMRLLLFTFAPMQFMFGISKANFRVFLVASILGISPLIFLEAWFGSSLFDWYFETFQSDSVTH